MSGFICIYALDVTTGNGSWDGATCPYTLPEEYCPSISTTAPVITGNGGSWTGYISVSTAGKIVVGNYGNKGSGDKRRGFLMYPISMQHSVSQNGDWTIFNFGTGYALSTRKVYKTISATAPYGSLYFCSYRFNSPDIYDSILYADVNPVTGNGLWLGHYVEIKNVTDVRCYLSSATSMSNVGMYVQETVIGKLKQYSVSHIIKTKQIDTTTDPNGYVETGLSARQIPIGIGGMYNARYAFHTGTDAQQGRTIRLMAWDGSIGPYSNKKINVIVYYIEV